MAEIIATGTWVEVERVVFTPEERAPQVPDDTRKTPYVVRISGFLQGEGTIGTQVTIKTLIGRTVAGVLRTVNPSYQHGFGKTVPELLTIGLGGKA